MDIRQPPSVTPEQIAEHSIKQSRSLLLNKNVIASFGVFFRLGIPSNTKKPNKSTKLK
jgi:hypothetical protein